MKILITSAASRLARELASGLSRSHDVLLTDRRQVSTERNFVRADLGHDESTNDLVRGMDAIVHSGETDPGASVSEQLDVAMRCTYNLLSAAGEEGVPRLIYLSSLRILDAYDEDLVVTERWRPVPTTDVPVLCYHLGEYVCREFAREKRIEVACLRLGEMVWGEEEAAAGSSSALHVDDAIQAVEGALVGSLPTGASRSPATWGIFHVQSTVPGGRYLTKAAQENLGYEPAPRG